MAVGAADNALVSSNGGQATVYIYFGTQTGRAEAFAYELRDEAAANGFLCKVLDLEDFAPGVFASHRIVLLVVSNTGDGDPPDNAVGFHKWLVDPSTPARTLEGVHFAIFGLGDRHYVHFNRMGQVIQEHMERLGARRIYERGIGDDGGDIVQDFGAWKRGGLWSAVGQVAGAAGGGKQGTVGTAPGPPEEPTLRLATGVSEAAWKAGQPSDALARFYFQAEQVMVSQITELRQEPSVAEGLSTVHIEFDVHSSSSLADYEGAGTMEVLPENSPDDVEGMVPLLWFREENRPVKAEDLDCFVSFVPGSPHCTDTKEPFPTPCKLRDALTLYCNLRGAPTRRMLQGMQPRVAMGARARITRLLADDAALRLIQDEALAWTQREFWTALGVERLDLGTFLRHCPRQRARPYTIASSPCASPGQIHLCVSLVSRRPWPLDVAVEVLREKGVLPPSAQAPPRSGLFAGTCSEWLCTRVQPGSRALARVRPSGFRLAGDDVPLVMVGAGAGVAPFRAFWNELACSPRRAAPAALFFGCRGKDRDWIYRTEMRSAVATEAEPQRPLSELFLAFSRPEGSGRCAYVQDRLREQRANLGRWLAQGGIVYICGSNAMGRGVLALLAEILQGGSAEVQRLQVEGRVVQELWGEPPRPPQHLDKRTDAGPEPEQKRRKKDAAAGQLPAEAVLELIESRRSIFPKDYTGEVVDHAKVQQLLSVARWAPTHGKTEPWRFVVFAGDGRHRLIDATLAYYEARDATFWSVAWNGEFRTFADFKAHVSRQREEKWLRCSHLIGICMRRQQQEAGKRLFPEHEEIAAVACAVQNMHLVATTMRIGAYWSSWFEHFTASPDGVRFQGLKPEEGDRWLGVFCIGQTEKIGSYRAARRPVEEISEWRAS